MEGEKGSLHAAVVQMWQGTQCVRKIWELWSYTLFLMLLLACVPFIVCMCVDIDVPVSVYIFIC